MPLRFHRLGVRTVLSWQECEKVDQRRMVGLAAAAIIIVWAALVFLVLFWNGDRW